MFMAIVVSETIYIVEKLDSAIAFYSQLGFQLLEKQDWGWALFSLPGGNKIGLLERSVCNSENNAPRIAFKSDDIESERNRLKSLGVEVSDIEREPSTIRSFSWRDVDGNSFFVWDDGSRIN